jgi:hypothetical protein
MRAYHVVIQAGVVAQGSGSLAVLLDARGAQARKAVAVNRVLPGEELLYGERVSAAGFFKRQQATAHGGYHFGLAADHPAHRLWSK